MRRIQMTWKGEQNLGLSDVPKGKERVTRGRKQLPPRVFCHEFHEK
jgi:hypothetical protein